jgi:glutathione S-transferase
MSTATAAPALRLRYFNIEGPAEKIRLTLSIAKIPFQDDRVVFDDWASVKPTTPYGQLPVLYVDDEAMAQSDAILRYCGRLATARGTPLYDETRAREIDEALSLAEDMRESWYPNLVVGMSPEKFNLEKGSDAHAATTKAMRERWVRDELPRYCGFISKRVAGGKFLCGDQVTIADCALVPLLRRFRSGGIDHVPKECLDAYADVVAYYDQFHAIPEVAAWYAARST